MTFPYKTFNFAEFFKMHPNTGSFLFEAPLRTLSTHIIMKTKFNIRNRFAQAVMTLLVTPLP